LIQTPLNAQSHSLKQMQQSLIRIVRILTRKTLLLSDRNLFPKCFSIARIRVLDLIQKKLTEKRGKPLASDMGKDSAAPD
jgi:hypothetical protein